MATTLAPVDSREVVRCDRCLLVQFQTSNHLCRRCRASLDEAEPEVVLAPPPPQMMPTNGNGRGHLNLAASIRSLRLRGERNRQEEISELMKDQFIADLLPFVSHLNGLQMSSVLAQVRDLTLRPRRSA